MADFKKPVFNPDAAEEYFSMLLTSYRDTANDIFRRDNEGRHASEQHYSAEYQKYLGMQIALREVLEYFGKYELGNRWISVEERLPEPGTPCLGYTGSGCEVALYEGDDKWWTTYHNYSITSKRLFTHWMPLPEPPKGE